MKIKSKKECEKTFASLYNSVKVKLWEGFSPFEFNFKSKPTTVWCSTLNTDITLPEVSREGFSSMSEEAQASLIRELLVEQHPEFAEAPMKAEDYNFLKAYADKFRPMRNSLGRWLRADREAIASGVRLELNDGDLTSFSSKNDTVVNLITDTVIDVMKDYKAAEERVKAISKLPIWPNPLGKSANDIIG